MDYNHFIEILKNFMIFDDAFFNQNWAGACWNHWARTGTVAGPVCWLWTLDFSIKTRKKEDRRGHAH